MVLSILSLFSLRFLMFVYASSGLEIFSLSS